MIPLRDKKSRYDDIFQAMKAGTPIEFETVSDVRLLELDKHKCQVSVSLSMQIGDYIFNVTKIGKSFKMPADPFDAEIAVKLATARALTKAAKTLDRQAQGKMRHNESREAAQKLPPLETVALSSTEPRVTYIEEEELFSPQIEFASHFTADASPPRHEGIVSRVRRKRGQK